MKLTLDPTDLKPEFQRGLGLEVDQNIPTPQVEFENLNTKAQAAVIAVGKAVFVSFGARYRGEKHIFPPR